MDLTLIPDLTKEILSYKGRLSESPDTLRNALDTYCRLLMIFETTLSSLTLGVMAVKTLAPVTIDVKAVIKS